MPVLIGSTDISAAYLGSTALDKIYVGSDQVWPAVATCTDVLAEPFNNLSAWTNSSGTIVAGRTGTAVSVGGTSGNVTYTIPSASESGTVTVGFAWRTNTLSGVRPIAYLGSDGQGITFHTTLSANGSALEIRRGNESGTVIATATGTVAINTWYYIELQVSMHDTAGYVIMQVDGTQVASVSGIDTKNAGTKTTFDWLRLRSSVSATSLFDDLYISAGQGCAFKGDQQIILPGTCIDVLSEPFNNFTTNGWALAGTVTPTIVAGRTGTAANLSGSTAVATYSIASGSQADTLTIGFAWRRTEAVTTIRDIVQLYSDTAATQHNRLTYTPSSTTLAFMRSGTTIASSATVTMSQNTWYYIEVQAKLHDTAGYVIVRINGTEVINVSGLDTKNAGTKTVYDTIRLTTGAALIGQYDDLYISAGQGCAFKGDQVIS